ncbi:DNA/RNA helicase domain-containing protein [Kineococcus sp. SYSU DK002]|uniref:DNA/RNA helicase domain-containing protein n=1 Tax=Kineococcus sp. SYSU DK002 TaxID=3383123 RepID=UPI003D7E0501
MSLVRRSAAQLHEELPTGSVVEAMVEQMLHSAGYAPSPSEVASWRASLPVLVTDLVEADLGDVEVLLEHQLPLTSKRADVVLAGVHPRTGDASYVVVELKQWSSAHRFEDNPDLVVVPAMAGPPKLHPVKQVRGYVDYLLDFTRSLEFARDAVAGVAYLHNATAPGAVAELADYAMDRSGRLFTGADRGALRNHLRTRLAPGVPGVHAADELLGSKVAPSRQLLKVAAAEIREREQFRLVGEQQEAVDLVLHQVRRAKAGNSKRVVVVTGGPGSGKSVIALSLLGELSRAGQSVLHATGSRSFTQTLRKVAGHRAPRVQSMFKYFNQFMTAEPNDLDVLILDEAHRIRETSVDRYTRAELRTGRPQVDELIAAARVPVFLLDQHQVVRPGEMGSLEEITRHAERLGVEVLTVPLDAQFRCGGSAEYVRWVQRLLGLSDEGVEDWTGDEHFQLRVADTPEEMEQFLAARLEEGYSARMSAGYCWPWSKIPAADGGLVPDVRIGDWARPWNVPGDRAVGDAPPAALWATQDGGFGQVGCIYTAQGFEYDWSGVVLGPDLVWREGRFVSERSANRDPDFRNRTRVGDADFDRLVRNVYKVLMTRGMVGTVLYSTDAETRAQLKRLVQQAPREGTA